MTASLPRGLRNEAAALDTGSSAARAEVLLARLVVFFRGAGLVVVGCVLGLDWRHYQSHAGVAALVGAVAAESSVLAAVIWRASRIRGWWAAADTAFLVGCLVAGARLTMAADGHTWVYFMYPFTVLSCYEIGVAFQRRRDVVAVTSVLAAGYALPALVIHHDSPLNVLPNAITYYSALVVSWAAAELRRSGHATDASRAVAIAQAADLARERERARHARILHDRVLQTLESLTRHRGIAADPVLCSHIAAEAAWLRALVEGTPIGEPGDLLSRLRGLVAQRTEAGLHIDFNGTLLRSSDLRWQLDRDAADALVDATAEALTNVAKHSGISSAVVRAAATSQHVTVSVLDHGAGFDPGSVTRGIGLAKSITERVEEAGGSVRIESSPGCGTYIEMTIPAGPVSPMRPTANT